MDVPHPPRTCVTEGHHHKVLGSISGPWLRDPGREPSPTCFHSHQEQTLCHPFLISTAFTLLHQKSTLNIWKEHTGPGITFPQGNHRIQDYFQMCQEDRLHFRLPVCALNTRKLPCQESLIQHLELNFWFKYVILLGSSSYYTISKRQYSSYWFDILTLFHFEFVGVLFSCFH